MRGIGRLVAGLLACACTCPALAWGPLGHAVVADIAQRHLSAGARAEVRRLLAPEHVDTLAAISSWADALRDDPAQRALWLRTRSQHYVDFHGQRCRYEPPVDCRQGQCVVGGIAHYAGVLADHSRSDADRREALKFVVHFVGDIHQPLHAGYRDDKGGNTRQVVFDGRGSNLHRVWDSGLLAQRGLDAAAYARMLDAQPGPVSPGPVGPAGAAAVRWAEESCRLTAQPGFYPRTRRIGRAYVDAELPVAEQRLRVAGYRLAAVLNQALSAGPTTRPHPRQRPHSIAAGSSASLER